ncbi:hypothetical protein E1A91_D09G109900v1 [Gossypium mustelinum]|uniref:Uncharacterized protein n=1 Tax=Gossypium mustelinum TaxID=34275 RepID=A0A5D2TKE6_GOSMU|nr:hypothetical protein E1A91_D09G109900v1 [Gossypium mustelinum]
MTLKANRILQRSSLVGPSLPFISSIKKSKYKVAIVSKKIIINRPSKKIIGKPTHKHAQANLAPA